MSDVDLSNLEIFPGGPTFGQAAETMGAAAPETAPPIVDPYAAKRRYNIASNEIVVENGRRVQVVTDYDGNQTRTDLGPAEVDPSVVKLPEVFTPEAITTQPPTGTPVPPPTDDDDAFDAFNAARAQQRTDAFSRLRALLSRFGLSELERTVEGIITSGSVDISDPNAIIFAIRGEGAYKRRFAANEARVRKGLAELDPASYIGLEDAYRELMRANGLPAGFYDQQSDFQKLIEGDVSAAELQTRIQQGYRRVRDADPEVRRQMRELYNVDDQALTAYFLDPEKATPLLERQARAAEIAARGREQGRLQLTATQAEELAARGITAEEAQARFAERGALEGLYTPMTGEEGIPDEIGATFGYNVQARQALERRRAQRLAEFQAGGQFARTTGATSGTVETGAGLAQ